MSLIKTPLGHDFRHTAINQVWRLIAGPLLLVLVPFYLTAEVQGYWYTFISLSALAVFADLGFSAILLLFSAHEFAYLKFNNDMTLVGSEYHLDRLATLWRFAIKWSVAMAFGVFPVVLVIGYSVLDDKATSVEWTLPWIIYGIASVFVFINSMTLSFIEGCDSVGDVQKIRFHISFITVVSTLLLLVSGTSLYALAFSLLAGAMSGSIIIIYRYKNTLAQLHKLAKNKAYPWFKEIMPLIWRYAVSWVSGYFIFSFFTPIAFHCYGAIEAGQVGLSMAISTALFGVANVWITTITPKINIYVAQKDYTSLNNLFKRHLILAIFTYIFGVAVLFLVVGLLKEYISFAHRLVSPLSLLIINLGWLAQVFINALAVYMRAHKREPLVIVSLMNGLYVGGITLLISVYVPFDYFFAGFLSAYLWVLPWIVLIFRKYKRLFL